MKHTKTSTVRVYIEMSKQITIVLWVCAQPDRCLVMTLKTKIAFLIHQQSLLALFFSVPIAVACRLFRPSVTEKQMKSFKHNL